MLSSQEVTQFYINLAKGKVKDSLKNNLLLSILAGVFIAFAGVGCCFATSFAGKFVGACVFPAGIIMVVLGGAKLFTGDCLLSLPLLTKNVKILETLKTLALVYIGNFIGSLLVAALVVYSGVLDSVKEAVIATAEYKSTLNFGEALLRGVLCNILVCVAVWLSYASKGVSAKILAMFFPILVFVIAGFEHCVANMYFLPAGIFTALKYDMKSALPSMLHGLYLNLIPVTIGNILGGALVGVTYRFTSYKKEEPGD